MTRVYIFFSSQALRRIRMTLSPPVCLNATVGLCVMLTIVTWWVASSRGESDAWSTQLNQATAWMLGVLIWIPIFDAIYGLHMIEKIPLLSISLLWPIFLLAFELHLTEHQTLGNESKRNRGTVQLETNAISGLAFALGGLLLTNLGKTFTKTVHPILSIVILICLVFIIPNPSTHFGSSTSAAVQSFQKVCLTYCVGILIGMVLINFNLIKSLKWSSAYESFSLEQSGVT